MASRFFLDTNVLLYLLTTETRKVEKAETMLHSGPVISVQVLNEFVNVARLKYKASWEAVEDNLVAIKLACEVVPLTIKMHEIAVRLSKSAHISLYDANIIAAAELAACDVLYTEDLSHGQKIGRVSVLNPFMKA